MQTATRAFVWEFTEEAPVDATFDPGSSSSAR
jgi:hypothetical protein